MIPFVAFCALMISSGFYNFHHAVESHEKPKIVDVGCVTDSVLPDCIRLRERAITIGEVYHLRQKRINLPGYNHAEPKQ